MKRKKITLGIVITLLFIAIILLFNTVYFVNEGDYAIVKRFSKVIDVKKEPGLAFKTPFIDQISFLNKKIAFYDVSPSEVITKDKKSMIVDTYSVWRISEPLKFLQTAGTVSEMEKRLEATIYGSLKTTIGSLNQMDIIASRTDNSINKAILDNSVTSLTAYGIELVDVQIKKFDLPASNKAAVFDRMVSERNQIVATFLAEGEEEANKIRNTADKEKQIIISKAWSDSAQLTAEGEKEYMKILSGAYNTPERSDFYEFIRGLDALKITMKGDKTIILPKDSKLAEKIISSN